MARFISDILQAREPYFSQKIAELEKIAGKPGIDVRLVGDLIQRQRNILCKLGLDESDTNPAELYHALVDKALSDSKSLAGKIGIVPADSPELAVKKSIEFVRKATGDNRLWTLKSAAAKKQLKENPPKKLMRIFSLRSIDSALKREPLSMLFAFAKKTEPKKWHEKYISQAAKLNPTDFDYHNIEISQVHRLRQAQLKKAGPNLNQCVYINYDVAGIIIITPKKRFEGDVLFLVHSILENIRLLKSHSLYLKLHGMESDFSSRLESIRKHGFSKVASNYKNFGWNAYSKYLNNQNILQDESPDFAIEDDVKLLEIKDLLDDESFWQHYFLVAPGENFMASCNLSDVILNAVNCYEPGQAHYRFGQISLQDELFGRYLQLPEVRKYVQKEASRG
ncbi:hypothetical protein KY385_02315 [Candidatus Parcubacteria bacterium]|nr:hypothetical protein [Candidatus Parcubacteria bacterium]